MKPADQSFDASHVYSFSSSGGGFGDESGATLTSLAHTSAIEAKQAAHSQDGAGSQAEYGAKNSLATVANGVSNIFIRLFSISFTYFFYVF